MSKLLSILLVSWNTRELTLECLDSIPTGLRGADQLEHEVVVVDNASHDGSAEVLDSRVDIQLVLNERNLGYSAAVNQAYRLSRGDLILLLNSDLRFEPGSLSKLVRFLEDNPGVAGVGPLYLNPDGTIQQHHYLLPTFPMVLANASSALRRLPPLARLAQKYRMLDEEFSAPRSVPQPSASCLLLRRSVLPETTVMDERYPIYFNDVALARSLAQQGEELWMTPEAVVIHEHGASTRLLGSMLRRHHIGALVRYLKATEPMRHVWIYRCLVFAQGLGALVAQRSSALPIGQLMRALSGDPGPLPQHASFKGREAGLGTPAVR